MSSRIRTLKPEFWASEQIASCSRDSRLLFIGLWNFCDDAGIHPASHLRLKMEIFPGDADLTTDDIKRFVNELITNNLLREYEVNGEIYWQVTGWRKHQRIDKPTYRHPPPSTLSLVAESSLNSIGSIDEHSTPTPRMLVESSTPEWNGKEGIGEEENTGGVLQTPPVVVSVGKPFTSSPNFSSEITEVFTHWQTTMNHPRAKLDSKRQHKIADALKDYSVEDLKQAINGCAKTPFNLGENARRQRYDELGLILRDADHIERFIQNDIQPPKGVKPNDQGDEWMRGGI